MRDPARIKRIITLARGHIVRNVPMQMRPQDIYGEKARSSDEAPTHTSASSNRGRSARHIGGNGPR